jgi:hypothetical protein
VDDINGQSVGGVDLAEGAVLGLAVEVPQQGESADAEEGVEYICNVSGRVGDSTVIRVLTPRYELREGVAIDPR